MRIANDDVSQFLNKLVPYVIQDGARNLNRVSRELHIPYQTLRFRTLRLKQQGISIVPVVQAEALGLERIRVAFELTKKFSDLVPFFGGLHQAAGLHYFSRSLVSQKFDTEFLIPLGKRTELAKLLAALEQQKIVANVVSRRLEWKEILMMRTQHYDYEHEEWDVDYTTINSDPSIAIPAPRPSTHYDHMDLQIVKSLQMDPWVKVVELAKNLHMTEGDVSYHLNRHVFDRGQVAGFRFKWIGSSDAWSKHTILGITMLFERISDEEARRAMAVITSTPFSWNHMRAEDGSYLTELLIPTTQLPETLQYLSDHFRKLELRPELLYPDWAGTSNFTIPYQTHEDQRGWKFTAEESLSYVLAMLETYHKG